MKSLDLINKRLNEVNKRLNERKEYTKVSSNGVSPYILSLVNEKELLEEAKKDLEILELVRGKSFFFHLSKQEMKKVNKWLEENDNED